MSLDTINEIANDTNIRDRVAASAAKHGVTGDPYAWVKTHIYELASVQGWVDAWDSAKASRAATIAGIEAAARGVTHADDYHIMVNAQHKTPIGADVSVITDAAINNQINALTP